MKALNKFQFRQLHSAYFTLPSGSFSGSSLYSKLNCWCTTITDTAKGEAFQQLADCSDYFLAAHCCLPQCARGWSGRQFS